MVVGQRLERSTDADGPLRRRSMAKVLVSLVAVAALILVELWLPRDRPPRADLAPSKQEIASPSEAPQEDCAHTQTDTDR